MAAYIIVLANFCRETDWIDHATPAELTLLVLVGLFHDTGRVDDRSEDQTELKSADYCRAYLIELGIEDPEALKFADYIYQHPIQDKIGMLFQSADALDISRCKSTLDLDKISLFEHLEPKLVAKPGLQINLTDINQSPIHRQFLLLAKEIVSLIAYQYDKKLPLTIRYHGVDIDSVPIVSRNKEKPTLKQFYEHAPNCFARTVEDFSQFEYLKRFFYHNDTAYITSQIPVEQLADKFVTKLLGPCAKIFLENEDKKNIFLFFRCI